MNDYDEIKQRLANRAEEVARLLYPNGKRSGKDWVVGNIHGDPGQTFKICVEGARVGVFCDFDGSGGGSNLLELWKQRHTLDFATACREARQWLGMPQPLQGQSEPSQRLTQPQTKCVTPKANHKPPRKDWKPLDPKGKVFTYLTEERKIPAETLEAYDVREANADDWRKGKQGLTNPETIVFVTADSDKAIQMVKYLPLERPNGKKVIWTSKAPKKGLWGKHAIPEGLDALTITEGEIDALTLASLKIPAVSVPFGAKAETDDGRNPNAEWLANDYEWLAKFPRVILAFDADTEGQRAVQGLIARIERERCYVATPPEGCKDWNEALAKGMSHEIGAAWQGAAPCDPEEFRNAGDFVEGLIEAIHPTNEEAHGYPNCLVPDLRIRPHEVTIWSGFSGHGKSLALLQLMTSLGDLGAKACIASLEIPTRKSLEFMLKQAVGCVRPTPEVITHFANWSSNWLWFYDSVGTRDLDSLLETFEYAFKRYGVDQFVVDSLVKLGVAHDDYEGQKRTVERLCDFAAKYPVHVHLVCHSRKAQDETRRPGKLDVAGHADITNLAHNGLTVWRNKSKERRVGELNASGKPLPTDVTSEPDGFTDVWKQRDTGEEPSVGLAFNLDAKTFVPLKDGRRGTLSMETFKLSTVE